MHSGEGIFLSNRAFFCRTGLFSVEPCILLSNRAFFCRTSVIMPVREIQRPPDGGWRWVRTDSPGNHDDLIKLPGMTKRYVSRVYYDGFYLPGWYHPTSNLPFRAVSPKDKLNKKCLPYSGEFLAFNDTSDYRWESFVAGFPVPEFAAAITVLQDGTPLYVVWKSFPGAPGYDLSGYYDPTSMKNYFVNSGVVSPSSVKMLLLNWQCGICGTFYWKIESSWLRLWNMTNTCFLYLNDESTYHDDAIKWKHFPRYWPFVGGIHRSRWIPRTMASDAELWCFLWSASE